MTNKTLINNSVAEGKKFRRIVQNKNVVSVKLLEAIKNNDLEMFKSVMLGLYVQHGFSAPDYLISVSTDKLSEIGHSFLIGLLSE